MKDSEFTVAGVGCLGVIGLVFLAIFVLPIISFWLCYFGGWVASLVIGTPLCNALNTLFDTNRFTPEIIPWYAGALGWIGRYFKSFNYNHNK